MATYINAMKFIKETKFGINLTINLDELIKETQSLKDERGNVKVKLSKRKEVGKWGETHSAAHDDWVPDASKAQKPYVMPINNPNTITKQDLNEDMDSLPF